jgi:hypothetical protein
LEGCLLLLVWLTVVAIDSSVIIVVLIVLSFYNEIAITSTAHLIIGCSSCCG